MNKEWHVRQQATCVSQEKHFRLEKQPGTLTDEHMRHTRHKGIRLLTRPRVALSVPVLSNLKSPVAEDAPIRAFQVTLGPHQVSLSHNSVAVLDVVLGKVHR